MQYRRYRLITYLLLLQPTHQNYLECNLDVLNILELEQDKRSAVFPSGNDDTGVRGRADISSNFISASITAHDGSAAAQ